MGSARSNIYHWLVNIKSSEKALFSAVNVKSQCTNEFPQNKYTLQDTFRQCMVELGMLLLVASGR